MTQNGSIDWLFIHFSLYFSHCQDFGSVSLHFTPPSLHFFLSLHSIPVSSLTIPFARASSLSLWAHPLLTNFPTRPFLQTSSFSNVLIKKLAEEFFLCLLQSACEFLAWLLLGICLAKNGSRWICNHSIPYYRAGNSIARYRLSSRSILWWFWWSTTIDEDPTVVDRTLDDPCSGRPSFKSKCISLLLSRSTETAS